MCALMLYRFKCEYDTKCRENNKPIKMFYWIMYIVGNIKNQNVYILIKSFDTLQRWEKRMTENIL